MKAIYEGRIHVRPLDRGVVLEDFPVETYFEEWLREIHREISYWTSWEGRVRLTVEFLQSEPEFEKDEQRGSGREENP